MSGELLLSFGAEWTVSWRAWRVELREERGGLERAAEAAERRR